MCYALPRIATTPSEGGPLALLENLVKHTARIADALATLAAVQAVSNNVEVVVAPAGAPVEVPVERAPDGTIQGVVPEAAPEATPTTLEDVRDELKIYAEENGRKGALELLSKFDVAAISKLQPERYGEFIAAMRAAA